ncbi:NAD(P)/FAD-dependent oxidoreductase [Aridibaculum aurantiacum]|uniref:NAD(P)/FAD-dependent oxidoreductase n=1 Tax=Aridibaculum aurantiacum TaxID=2810307 RepID=UPI001A972A5B|nr:NAD(P)/FAD-dependent oxidoreductase [Aridibaculum aurantiacum]
MNIHLPHLIFNAHISCNTRMLQPTIQTKVCIIGAGPAGATTSLFLSKKNIRHIIVDAASFPRDKVCGDAIDLKVMRVLNQLDPNIVQNEIIQNNHFTNSWGASVIISKKKQLHFDIDKQDGSLPFFLVSKRAYFDNFLVSKLDPVYADFMQGTAVKSIRRENNKWIITAIRNNEPLTIKADMIVGADGDHSTVLRCLGERKIDRAHYAGALRQYWKGISGFNEQNRMEVYLPKSLPLAYLWIFPLANDEANVGCGLVSDLIKKNSIDLKKLFHQLITEDPAIAHRFAGATPLEKPIGWGLPFASQQRNVYGDGYLLVGDAASLVCPTTGEGIGPGMISGLIAAEFIARAIEHDRFDKSIFTNYDREIYKRLRSDVRKYKLVKKLSPMLYNSVIKIWASTGVSGYLFKLGAKKWMRTASKPIEVDMDD